MNLKHLVAAAIVLVTGLGSVQASDLQTTQNSTPIEQSVVGEQQQGSEFDLSNADAYKLNDKVIGGIIIGAIIGSMIGADDLEVRFQNRRQRRGPVVCYAESYRGQIFSARSSNPRAAQNQALNQCYWNARSCRPRGCQVVNGGYHRRDRHNDDDDRRRRTRSRYRTFPVPNGNW